MSLVVALDINRIGTGVGVIVVQRLTGTSDRDSVNRYRYEIYASRSSKPRGGDTLSDPTREVSCRRTVNDGKDRCPWRAPLDELPTHAEETGHSVCVVCRHSLTDYETGACASCIDQARNDLAEIADAYATLPTVVERSGYRMGALPGGDALVMLADGSLENPQTPNAYTQPRSVGATVHVEHPELVGDDLTLPAFVEERVPSDGREHLRDHWPKDPLSVLAVIEHHERDWHITFGHGPSDDLATVTRGVSYLQRWLSHAARTHPSFDDFALELRQLRHRLVHVVGLADDPMPAPAECFDCGGRLQRTYRPLRTTITDRLRHAAGWIGDDDRRIAKHRNADPVKHSPDHDPKRRPRVPSRVARVRQAVAGDDREGLADTWACSSCRRTYDETEYGLALRMRANSISGWVSVRVAAETLRRPEQTIWRWQREMAVPSACSVTSRRVLVDWEQVKALSDEAGRRNHESRSA